MNIPAPPTIHDQREILPPDDDAWQDSSIVRTDNTPNGWNAILTIGSLDYWVRAYRMENGEVRFETQARRCAKAERAFLRYVDGLGERIRA